MTAGFGFGCKEDTGGGIERGAGAGALGMMGLVEDEVRGALSSKSKRAPLFFGPAGVDDPVEAAGLVVLA